MHTTAASRNVRLVPFVEACDEGRQHPCDPRPGEPPTLHAWLGESGPPRAKEKQAHDKVADKMPGLAEDGMPDLKPSEIDSKQVVKDWIEERAGISRRAEPAGFRNDNPEPEPGGNPDLYDFIF